MYELKKYLKDTLGVEIEVNQLKPDKLNALPMFLVNEYNFQLTKLYHHDILLVFVKNSFTSEKIRKHLDIIRAAFNTITVIVISQIEPYNRLRLIEKKISFIIPGKQMYLPDLLIDLKEFGIKLKKQPQKMHPAAQMLLLYHLQMESLEGINLKGIAEKLRYNPMAITRAVYYLHNTGICTLHGKKDKFISFNYNGLELWEKAEPLMYSPVKKAIYYSGFIKDRNLYKCNINALAHYSDLNDDVVEYYAVRPGYIRFIGGVNLVNTGLFEGNICIEEWKYDPGFLTETEFVDPLSLYLYFRNRSDERIEMALEQVIRKTVW